MGVASRCASESGDLAAAGDDEGATRAAPGTGYPAAVGAVRNDQIL